MNNEARLILFTVIAVVVLVILIARFRLHPFIALMLVSLAVGFHSGMKPVAIAKAFQEGVGQTLGFLGIVVGLGIILGKMLAESGGARVIADNLIRRFGVKRLPYVMLFVALVVGIPVLFTVGLVLLVPLVYTTARETGTPLLRLAIPVAAGLSVSQGFLPPHPGPMLAIEQLGANPGKTILYGILIGVPTAVVAGPLFASLVARRVQVKVPLFGEEKAGEPPERRPPSFALTLLTILTPVLLMLLASIGDLLLDQANRCREWVNFLGSPIIAMLLAVLFSIYSFGYARGFTAAQILKFMEECVGPAASIMLIVGAGGGLSKMLERGGVGVAIGDIVANARVSPLLLGWAVAASVRLAVGSATVAITMASALLAPVVVNTPSVNRELLVLAMGAGSLFCSHVNDGGFWFVKETLNLTVMQTLQTWTVLETSIGLVGLALVMLLSPFV